MHNAIIIFSFPLAKTHKKRNNLDVIFEICAHMNNLRFMSEHFVKLWRNFIVTFFVTGANIRMHHKRTQTLLVAV